MHTRPFAPASRALILMLAVVMAFFGVLSFAAPARADETGAEGAGLDWGFKASLRHYVGDSGILTYDGASRNEDGTFHFPVESSSYDSEAKKTEVQFGGEVDLQLYGTSTGEHLLDFRISNPRVVISGDEQVIYATVSSREKTMQEPANPLVDFGEVPLVSLDTTTVEPSTADGVTTWSGLPTTLTDEGSKAFVNSYAAGTKLDAATFSYEGDGGKPDLGDPDWDAPGTPKYATVTAESTASLQSYQAYEDDTNGIVYRIDLRGSLTAFASETLQPLGGSETVPYNGKQVSQVYAFSPDSGKIYSASVGALKNAETGVGEDGGIVASWWDQESAAWKHETVATPPELAALERSPERETREGLAWMIYDEANHRLVTMLVGSEVQHPDISDRFRIVVWEEGADGQLKEVRSYPAVQPEITNGWGEGRSGYTGWLGGSGDTPHVAAAGTDGSIFVLRSSVRAYTPDAESGAQDVLRIDFTEEGTLAFREIADSKNAVWIEQMPDRTVWAQIQSDDGDLISGLQLPLEADESEESQLEGETYIGLGFFRDTERGSWLLSDYVNNTVNVFYQNVRVAQIAFEGLPSIIGQTSAPGVFVNWRSFDSGLNAYVYKLSRVDPAGSSPVIATQPVDGAAAVGADGTAQVPFSVEATGDPDVSYQWQVKKPGSAKFVDVEGATSSSATVPLTAAENGASVRVIVSNDAGKMASDVVTAQVQSAPVFVDQPRDAKVEEGKSVSLSALAEGVPDPSIVWERYDGSSWVPVSADQYTVDGGTLTVNAAGRDLDGAKFRARAVNAAGETLSGEATLSVVASREIPEEGLELTGVGLEWDGNGELQILSPAGPANHLSAGVSDGSEATYLSTEGNVHILQEIDGEQVEASYDSRAAFIDAGGRQFVRVTDGTAKVFPDGSVEASWTGSWSVNMYGGMVPFTLTNPKLKIDASGNGQLTADMVGYHGDMANPTEKTPLDPAKDVVIESFENVQVDTLNGFEIVPDYRGVEVTIPEGGDAMPQDREGDDWGSWPQSFVDYQILTGLHSYWYSSGAEKDSLKVANPFLIDFSTATPKPAGEAPKVTEQPASAAVDEGGEATFTSAASGDPAPTVQWQRAQGPIAVADQVQARSAGTDTGEWSDIPGATEATYTVTNAEAGEWSYRAVFTNEYGQAISDPAVLTVKKQETPQPVNPVDPSDPGAPTDNGTNDAGANGGGDAAGGNDAESGLADTGGQELGGIVLAALVLIAVGAGFLARRRPREKAGSDS